MTRWTTQLADDDGFIDGVTRDETLTVVFGQPPRRTAGNTTTSGVPNVAAGNDDVGHDGVVVAYDDSVRKS